MTASHLPDSFLKRLRYGVPNPQRDWFILLTISVMVLVGSIVWNVWTFETVAQGGIIGSIATSSPPIFSRASLDTIHTVFENRANEKAKYETGSYHFADPSQ
ncbi:MAG: hypothetical protein NTU85_00315 [Candidatus Kaiserbacteria bacterium]|nr:hypothetical protein [Candidatus Kaiserbacteria bacterium]